MTRSTSALIDKALAVVLGLFVLSVVVRGGNLAAIVNVAGAASAVVLLGAALLLATARVQMCSSASSFGLLLGLLLVVAGGIAGLFSISPHVWLTLPGRVGYAPAAEALQGAPWHAQGLALAIDPVAAHTATFTVLVALACAVLALTVSRATALRFLGLIAGIAVVQALLGLLQLALSSPSFLAFGTAVGGNRAAGTFVNKNHFATLLAMSLPLLILRSAGLLRFSPHSPRSSSLRDGWWSVATAIVAAALVSSVSRAGVAAGALAAAGASVVAFMSARDLRQRVLLGMVIALAVLLSAASGLGLLLRSLEGIGFAQSAAGRHALNIATWHAALEFFPIGGGLGSYAIAFQRFQTPALEGFYEYAHNDYLQLLFELGAVGVAALLAWGGAFIAAALSAARSTRKGRALASPALACLLGCAAFAVHAWFDFPAHIPALAWTATTLAALATREDLLGESVGASAAGSRQKRRRHRSRAADTGAEPEAPAPVVPMPTAGAREIANTPVSSGLFSPPPSTS